MPENLKKNEEYEGDGYINCKWGVKNGPQRLGKKNEGIEDLRKNVVHPDQSIVKIGLNTERSPRNLRRLAVTQTPVKDHQLTLM